MTQEIITITVEAGQTTARRKTPENRPAPPGPRVGYREVCGPDDCRNYAVP